MISIITEITRRKLFRYASNVFVNLFQNLGSGYMKLLPEFQIEYISVIEEKKREDKISLYLRTDLSPAQSRILINFYNINHIKFFSAKKSSEAVASLPQWKLRH